MELARRCAPGDRPGLAMGAVDKIERGIADANPLRFAYPMMSQTIGFIQRPERLRRQPATEATSCDHSQLRIANKDCQSTICDLFWSGRLDCWSEI
jgi:hypothetical protein